MVIKLKKTKHKKSFKITCTLLLLICITIGLFHFLNKDHTSNKSVSKSLNKETKKIVKRQGCLINLTLEVKMKKWCSDHMI